MNQILEDCQLEWDVERGVLYVHNKETGATVLRICGMPALVENLPLPDLSVYGTGIDITLGRLRHHVGPGDIRSDVCSDICLVSQKEARNKGK